MPGTSLLVCSWHSSRSMPLSQGNNTTPSSFSNSSSTRTAAAMLDLHRDLVFVYVRSCLLVLLLHMFAGCQLVSCSSRQALRGRQPAANGSRRVWMDRRACRQQQQYMFVMLDAFADWLEVCTYGCALLVQVACLLLLLLYGARSILAYRLQHYERLSFVSFM